MMTTRFDGGVHVKLHRVCAGLEDWSSGFGEIGWAGFSSGTQDQVPLRQNHRIRLRTLLRHFTLRFKLQPRPKDTQNLIWSLYTARCIEL